MAKRVTSADKILLDPLFSVPEGAEEVYTKEKEQSEVDIETADITSIADEFGDDYYDSTDNQDIGDEDDLGEDVLLGVPEQFVLFHQQLRRAPGGQHVVDIIIAVEDVPGATDYEVQVTKA